MLLGRSLSVDGIMYSAVISVCEKSHPWAYVCGLPGTLQGSNLDQDGIIDSVSISACVIDRGWVMALGRL